MQEKPHGLRLNTDSEHSATQTMMGMQTMWTCVTVRIGALTFRIFTLAISSWFHYISDVGVTEFPLKNSLNKH